MNQISKSSLKQFSHLSPEMFFSVAGSSLIYSLDIFSKLSLLSQLLNL